MYFCRMLVGVLRRRLSIGTFRLVLVLSLRLWGKNLLATIHTCRLIYMMREPEIAALLILHYVDVLERVM